MICRVYSFRLKFVLIIIVKMGSKTIVNTKGGSGTFHNYLQELLAATQKINATVTGDSHENFDYETALSYADVVRQIHKRINKDYDPSDGRSKIIERFINSWNNLVMGVFYVEGIIHENQKLNEKQYAIFQATLEEIIQYVRKHSAG